MTGHRVSLIVDSSREYSAEQAASSHPVTNSFLSPTREIREEYSTFLPTIN